MTEIPDITDGVSATNSNNTCNSSMPVSFEGEDHEFHNPQLHHPATLQVVLYGYILPVLVVIR